MPIGGGHNDSNNYRQLQENLRIISVAVFIHYDTALFAVYPCETKLRNIQPMNSHQMTTIRKLNESEFYNRIQFTNGHTTPPFICIVLTV